MMFEPHSLYVTHSVKMSQMSPIALLSYGQSNVENVKRSVVAWLTFRTLTFRQ